MKLGSGMTGDVQCNSLFDEMGTITSANVPMGNCKACFFRLAPAMKTPCPTVYTSADSESGAHGKRMTHLEQTIKTMIRQGEESGYIAECIEIAVATQGRTIDETVANLKEAVALHLEAEAPATFGFGNVRHSSLGSKSIPPNSTSEHSEPSLDKRVDVSPMNSSPPFLLLTNAANRPHQSGQDRSFHAEHAFALQD
jgi:predicted RNase H-like HicB family nuclease